MEWRIGDVTVTRVPEMLPVLPIADLLGGVEAASLDRHRPWLEPHFLDEAGNAHMSIHTFVVRSQGWTIIVDTCVGNDKQRSFPGLSDLQTPYLESLAEVGCPPESVDVVLCTHLHFDHVGWNTRLVDGSWVPTFQNARYLCSQAEWDHWRTERERGAEPLLDRDQVLADSVQPIVDAGMLDLVSTDHRLNDEVRLVHTPGHTPGHVSVRISSKGDEAVITGDLFHHPVQAAEPGWCAHADGDPEAAAATRRRFIDEMGAAGLLVLGTHFAPPTAGRFVRDGSGWRFEVAR